MNAQPAPVVSGRYFSGDLPATCFQEMPLAEGGTSSNGKVETGAAAARREHNPRAAVLANPRNSSRRVIRKGLFEDRRLKVWRPFDSRGWKSKHSYSNVNSDRPRRLELKNSRPGSSGDELQIPDRRPLFVRRGCRQSQDCNESPDSPTQAAPLFPAAEWLGRTSSWRSTIHLVRERHLRSLRRENLPSRNVRWLHPSSDPDALARRARTLRPHSTGRSSIRPASPCAPAPQHPRRGLASIIEDVQSGSESPERRDAARVRHHIP